MSSGAGFEPRKNANILNLISCVHSNNAQTDEKTATLNVVKCNLTELTTKSACVPLEVRGLNTYAFAHVSEFHILVDCSLA